MGGRLAHPITADIMTFSIHKEDSYGESFEVGWGKGIQTGAEAVTDLRGIKTPLPSGKLLQNDGENDRFWPPEYLFSGVGRA